MQTEQQDGASQMLNAVMVTQAVLCRFVEKEGKMSCIDVRSLNRAMICSSPQRTTIIRLQHIFERHRLSDVKYVQKLFHPLLKNKRNMHNSCSIIIVCIFLQNFISTSTLLMHSSPEYDQLFCCRLTTVVIFLGFDSFVYLWQPFFTEGSVSLITGLQLVSSPLTGDVKGATHLASWFCKCRQPEAIFLHFLMNEHASSYLHLGREVLYGRG